MHNDVKVSTSAYYTLQQSVNIECIVNNITKWMEEYVTLKKFDYSLIIRYVYLRRSETVLLRNGFCGLLRRICRGRSGTVQRGVA